MLLFLAVSHLVALIQTGVEIKITRDSLMNEVKLNQMAMKNYEEAITNKTQVPVRVTSTKSEFVMASVDPDCFDAITNFSTRWRLSNSGYAICTTTVDGVSKTVYMHKLIFNGPARHIDGDRLNNTIDNLMSPV